MEHTSLESEVLEELITCNICRGFIGIEIFQCALGHIYCRDCAKHLNTCGECRSPMPNSGARTGIRNRALERLLTYSGELPCLHDKCDVKLPFLCLESHYDRCTYRVISCPCRSCAWTGKISDIKTHILGAHDDILIARTGKIALCLTNPSSLLINAYAEKLIEYQDEYFLFSAWLIKDQRTPSTLTCCVTQLTADGVETRATTRIESRYLNCSFSCEKSPWTLTDDLQEVRRSTHNLILDWSTALRIGLSDALYRDLDQLKLEPRPTSLNLPITLTFSDTTGRYSTRPAGPEPVAIALVDIELEEGDYNNF